MPEELPSFGPSDAAWVADQQRWAKGWRRVVFPYIFLAWLIQIAVAIPKDSRGAGVIAGYVVLAAFCICYVVTVPAGWQQNDRRYRVLVATLCILFVAELPFAHADTFIMAVFVSAVAVIKYGERALVIPGIFTVLAIFLPPAVHSWHDTIGTGLNNGTGLAIPLTGLAMFGFGRVIYGNRALADARIELARLAAENERSRIARDLHDLLGHSLTTITVKAELANRLARHDIDDAIREIGEVAALSRRALGDVRAAVSNYREVTLAGELATGRELLRAAGIVAELPPAVDIVDESTQELFGWVLREGLTNVVRHSHAHSCTVRISPSSVEISDDGVGSAVECGNGLAGLAERVALAGGAIEAGPTPPRGWRLTVRLADATA
jgi:two-component system, NarL family, sensor histidine kinase DesK